MSEQKDRLRDEIAEIWLDYDLAIKSFMAALGEHPPISEAINKTVALFDKDTRIAEMVSPDEAREAIGEAKKQERDRAKTIIREMPCSHIAHEYYRDALLQALREE